jgi:hypothetical protein
MSEIFKTKDYSIFKKHPQNREVTSKSLNKIINSMKTKNLMEFEPILVDSDMQVISGQNRLEAAKQLGLEVSYRIIDSAATIDVMLLGANNTPWTLDDYVHFYCSQKKEPYIKFVEFCKENDLTSGELLGLLRPSSRSSQIIKNGEFTISPTYLQNLKVNLQRLKIISDQLNKHLLKYPNICKTLNFKKAMISFLSRKELDFYTFLKKLAYKSECLRPCTNIETYNDLFMEIYNWKNHKPIN